MRSSPGCRMIMQVATLLLAVSMVGCVEKIPEELRQVWKVGGAVPQEYRNHIAPRERIRVERNGRNHFKLQVLRRDDDTPVFADLAAFEFAWTPGKKVLPEVPDRWKADKFAEFADEVIREDFARLQGIGHIEDANKNKVLTLALFIPTERTASDNKRRFALMFVKLYEPVEYSTGSQQGGVIFGQHN